MSRIICVGSVAKDIFFPTSDGDFFETPEDLTAKRKVAFEVGAKYQIENRFEALGGVAANTSVGLSRLGLHVAAYGATGNDEIGNWIRESLRTEGVSLELLETRDGVKSDLSSILVFEKDGERTIFYNRDSAERFRVDRERFSGSDWILMSSLNGEWERNLLETLEGKRLFGAKLAINPGQKNLKDNPGLVLQAIAESDVVLLNKDEAIELVLALKKEGDHRDDRMDDERFLLSVLHRRGARVVALTDGLRGAWAFDGHASFHAVARHTQRGIDTTGAGDAFGSAFLAAIILNLPLPEALSWGMVNGANVVRHFGAIEGLVRHGDMPRFLPAVTVEPIVLPNISDLL